jgi:hypothetical protein
MRKAATFVGLALGLWGFSAARERATASWRSPTREVSLDLEVPTL